MIEKPMFSSTNEYDSFTKFCQENAGHVYAIDWQRALSTPLYATLGQIVPFADSIEYTNKQAFAALAGDTIEDVRAIFTEGRGNALADIGHRGHLLKALREGKWACAGMLADMGIHPINAITGAGFELNEITGAFFGGVSDENGYREFISHSREEGAASEMFARVDAQMSWNGKQIPVHFECGKGSAPNVNDGRTIFKFESGKTLVHEFGSKTNTVTLYDRGGKVLAMASDRGEPYERMFLEASHLFERWAASANGQARIAYGAESREAIELIEQAHRHACDYPPADGMKIRQYALDEMGIPQDVGAKASDFKIVTLGVGDYKTISPEEVIEGSCQWHSTAEGATYDKASGCFWYVDIEHGLLMRYNANSQERTTWKLTSDELDVDGRPKQMLSVAKVNQDGSVMVILSSGGENAGLNYFNPETGELKNVGNIPNWEQRHPDNRSNDETTITIGGKNYICYGTMDRHWNHRYDDNSQYQRTAAYYLLDPITLNSRPIVFEPGQCPDPLITNGLADGGDAPNGKKFLFWAETVEDPRKGGGELNVYRGVFNPTLCTVSGIEVFKNHQELGGMMNGVETYGRADGAKRGQYHGRDVLGVSVLELGQIRLYYSDPNDREYKHEALRIELPKGMTRNTQFALGEDNNGQPVCVVTSQDAGHFSRRWKAGERDKAKDGLNGSVIVFGLPEGLTAHPQAIGRVDYPNMADAPTITPSRIIEGKTEMTITPANGRQSVRPTHNCTMN